MNERKIGILLSYLNIALHAIVGFLYVPILLHYIGKSEYGLYQLIGSLIAYFSIMDFGLTAAVTRFYTKYKALKDKVGMENILAISLYGYGGATALSLLVGGICYWNLDSIFGTSMTAGELLEAKHMFLLLLFNIAVSLSTMVFRSVINAHEKFLFLKGLETVQLILQPVLVILILQKYPTAMAVAVAQTVLNVGLILARIYYCFARLHITIQFHYWNQELFRDFKKLALSVFVVTLIDQVFWKTNQIILGIVQGTGAVAVYSIASLIYMNYMALSTAISGVYLPHITEMVAQRKSMEELTVLFIQIGRWQYYLLALVATGFIIFGRQFIQLWAGSGFEDSYWITILIILPFTIDLIQNIGLAILQAMNRYEFRARIYFLTGVLNLVLAIPLGMKSGGIGCAVATGFSMLMGNGVVMNYFYQKYIRLDIPQFWKQIGRISLSVGLCLVVGYGVDHVIPGSGKIVFLLKILGYTVFYGIMVYFTAMNPEEKEKVRGIGKKLG
ncbi:oligosaccharide flippase family protein [Acidaminococcus sp. DS4831]|uniref:oligosaccharide flippase family protein n=1 Tax=Acidaminococcus sp. DS4831 TaxID=3141399 RepID=UPI0032E4C848